MPASISAISDEVRLELPDAPVNLILAKLRTVIREFCRRTDAWTHTETITIESGTTQYNLTPPTDTVALKIMYIEIDGYRYSPFTDAYRHIAHNFKLLPGEDIIEFDSQFPPSAGTDFEVTYSVLPTADSIDDFIYQDYSRELVAGTIAYLMKMPKRPFTDFNLSQFFMKEYMKGVSRELTRQASDGTNYNKGFSA